MPPGPRLSRSYIGARPEATAGVAPSQRESGSKGRGRASGVRSPARPEVGGALGQRCDLDGQFACGAAGHRRFQGVEDLLLGPAQPGEQQEGVLVEQGRPGEHDGGAGGRLAVSGAAEQDQSARSGQVEGGHQPGTDGHLVGRVPRCIGHGGEVRRRNRVAGYSGKVQDLLVRLGGPRAGQAQRLGQAFRSQCVGVGADPFPGRGRGGQIGVDRPEPETVRFPIRFDETHTLIVQAGHGTGDAFG
ncbi:hypothetical protein HNR07_000715 [Nocardiopsis metallicus]|uniref:Uncharacterized protein n=1 Tax=Nocardiopsis metallicus TaxID=179819 RepID=A0A840WHN0_9ACTN|nr:hypothetical protein [Nocardiopsis metallicus]